ncbi:MAG: serine protease [Neomegalonema sp.]|nr:serine protease [Neomegalonema sp.]
MYRLAENWLVATRPPSPGERAGALSPPVAADELDYRLVRLERPAGEETVADRFDPIAAHRGWIDLSSAEEASETAQSVVVIYHHPNGEPLKLDFGVHLGSDAGDARMRHNVNTKPGSSGSPILTVEHQPIALHHSGDPAQFKVQNGGVPLARILSNLEQRGVKPFWR